MEVDGEGHVERVARHELALGELAVRGYDDHVHSKNIKQQHYKHQL